ncbi:Holliday junction resolvase RuvX [Gulosibacter molinativorax]|uniref:Putative pre-16S rRNA nuclease n=1 Tax=Gulosibacter molinativorax TaxID=256821 RepID=A0ABT7C7L7_9MICO|nr:Holliday junction resolvase RuvX [Gulosibacter molinativorax]MDJ1371055.1 Holliday junction resolvase RuvX [Gulosibacter molinativorax]QUY61415.1 Putative pre-16S rRNA nuclease [Gulosibacter molinativorax]
MRRGIRFGVDVGKARIGIARSDPDGLLAVPLETVKRDLEGDGHVRRIVELVEEYEAFELIVGHPLNMRGESTPSTEDAVGVAQALAAIVGVPVRLLDERLTTVSAAKQFRAAGKQASRSRQVIDQAAAVVLLQDALDRERQHDQPPGIEVSTS